MRRFFLCIFLLISTLIAPAQQSNDEPATPPIRVATHYVLVDLVATDKAGNPVTDLKPEEVTVKENGKAQKLAHFSAERNDGKVKVAAPLPAGVYSNRPEYKQPEGALSILLLDGLNTVVQDAQSARRLMLKYVAEHYEPGQKMAVYMLTNRLIRLKDFTDNGDDLRAALEKYKPGMVANAPDQTQKADVTPRNSQGSLRTGGGNVTMYEIFNSFESGVNNTALEIRVRNTLGALRELALITGGHPGRKNLIWISSGLPITLSPEPFGRTAPAEVQLTKNPSAHSLEEETQGGGTLDLMDTLLKDMHSTAELLAASQIAVYPIDARGLFNGGVNANGTDYIGGGPSVYSGHLQEVFGGITNSQENMRDIANQTGGEAFVNRNDLDMAVNKAAHDGQDYYALAYTSGNKKFDGEYRRISVDVNRPGVQLRYRRGYFAVDPFVNDKKGKTEDLANRAGDSTFVQFDALIAPAAAQNGKASVPVKFRVAPNTISAPENGDKRNLNLDFYVVATDAATDKVVVNTGQTVKTDVDKGQYDQVSKQGLMIAVPVEVPPGRYNFRLAVQDHNSGAVGTLTAAVTVQ